MIKEIKEGQKQFGEDIAEFVNFILLSVVYFIGVGFTYLFAKIAGKHFLELECKSSQESYWTTICYSNKKESYYRQF